MDMVSACLPLLPRHPPLCTHLPLPLHPLSCHAGIEQPHLNPHPPPLPPPSATAWASNSRPKPSLPHDTPQTLRGPDASRGAATSGASALAPEPSPHPTPHTHINPQPHTTTLALTPHLPPSPPSHCVGVKPGWSSYEWGIEECLQPYPFICKVQNRREVGAPPAAAVPPPPPPPGYAFTAPGQGSECYCYCLLLPATACCLPALHSRHRVKEVSATATACDCLLLPASIHSTRSRK